MPAGSKVTLRNVKNDKYAGRVNAAVQTAEGRDLAALLTAEGLANPYAGKTKRSWCA